VLKALFNKRIFKGVGRLRLPTIKWVGGRDH